LTSVGFGIPLFNVPFLIGWKNEEFGNYDKRGKAYWLWHLSLYPLLTGELAELLVVGIAWSSSVKRIVPAYLQKEGELSSGAKERLGCCSTSKPAAREAELSKV